LIVTLLSLSLSYRHVIPGDVIVRMRDLLVCVPVGMVAQTPIAN